MAIIYIMPTPSSSPYGITTNKNVRKMVFESKSGTQTIEVNTNYGKRYAYNNPKVPFSVPLDITNKCYNVFNTEAVLNPYYKKEKDLPSNWTNSGIEKSEYITEQTFYELKHNVPANTYDTRVPNILKPDGARTKFMDFRFTLNAENATVLDTSIPDEELQYLMIKKSSDAYNSKFAASLQDFYTKNTLAQFYIADVEIEKQAKLRYDRDHAKFVSYVSDVVENFPEEKMYKLLIVNKLIQSKTTKSSMEEKLLDFSKSSTLKEIEKATFINYYKMCKEANKSDALDLEFNLQEAVNKRLIISTPDGYLWLSKKDTNWYEIAKTKEKLLKYFGDPLNKEAYETLKEEIKNK